MRVVVIGDRGGGLAGALARRFEAAGIEVLTGPSDVHGVAEMERLARRADAGVDAHVTDAEGKRRTVALLDRLLPAEAPLLSCCHAASATSTAAASEHPASVVGFGLLPPIDDRSLVECARGLRTSDDAAERAAAVWRAAGLEPVWVGDGAGLVMARILACLANEAAFAVAERTASAADVDRAMELGTRYPRGPLAWSEAIGLDAVLATLDALADEHGEDRYRAAPVLRRMVTAGHVGEGAWAR